jgi:hypothetical protein
MSHPELGGSGKAKRRIQRNGVRQRSRENGVPLVPLFLRIQSFSGSSRISLQCTVRHLAHAPRAVIPREAPRHLRSCRISGADRGIYSPTLVVYPPSGNPPQHRCAAARASLTRRNSAGGIEHVSQPPVRESRFPGRRAHTQDGSGSRERLPRNDSRALPCNQIHEEPFFGSSRI